MRKKREFVKISKMFSTKGCCCCFCHIIILSLISILLLHTNVVVRCEDLVELSCSDTSTMLECKQFQKAGFVSSTCIDSVCVCKDEKTAERITCTPRDEKQSNIIGGKCPCSPQAKCNAADNTCYCQDHFTASADKRRCIPELVTLGGECELDAQCHQADAYAICINKKCSCPQDFKARDGVCVSIVDPDYVCHNDTDCKSLGNGVECDTSIGGGGGGGLQRCICAVSYVKAKNDKKCLRTLKYQEECAEDQQCQKRLGPGGICKDNACKCADKFYAIDPTNPKIDNKQLMTIASSSSSDSKIICKRIVGLGEYCRFDNDCYQGQIKDNNSTDATEALACIFGECQCKKGYYSINEMSCIKSGAISTTMSSQLSMLHHYSIASLVIIASTIYYGF